MIDKNYETVQGRRLESIHLETSNNANIHAELCSFETFRVSLEDNFGISMKAWYFDAFACEEAIEFFGILRDELVKKEEA